MATCTKQRTPGEPDYLLGLSADEAEAVAAVLAYVSGSEARSRRRFTDGVLDALWEQGVESDCSDIVVDDCGLEFLDIAQ